jgi:hypothetical protein
MVDDSAGYDPIAIGVCNSNMEWEVDATGKNEILKGSYCNTLWLCRPCPYSYAVIETDNGQLMVGK